MVCRVSRAEVKELLELRGVITGREKMAFRWQHFLWLLRDEGKCVKWRSELTGELLSRKGKS